MLTCMSEAKRMFSIGEFSRSTGITVKTLRFYHDEKLLIPTHVDAQTGYRYYDPVLIARAKRIVDLRSLEFSLDQIREMLTPGNSDIIHLIDLHKSEVQSR